MTTSGGGSGATPFPVTAKALQPNLAGTRNACLCIIDPTQSGQDSLVYSSFLGGDHDTQGHSVAVNPSGSNITVAGFTTSRDFPTTANAYRSSAPPGGFETNCSNGFVTQIQSSQPGSPSTQYTMPYSTYLGANSSTARDDVYGITLDPTGLIVATGRTQSAGFPMTAGRSHHLQQRPLSPGGHVWRSTLPRKDQSCLEWHSLPGLLYLPGRWKPSRNVWVVSAPAWALMPGERFM